MLRHILFDLGPELNALLALLWCVIQAAEDFPGRVIFLAVEGAVTCLVFGLQIAHCFGLL